MRIALSGPTGSGKTALAHALGSRLGITVAKEDFEELMNSETVFRNARYKAAESEGEFRRAVFRNADSYVNWLIRREALLNSTNSYVADRWEADLLANWITQVGRLFDDKMTNSLIDKLQSRSRELTAVVLLPLSSTGNGALHETLKRNMQKSVRLCEYLVVQGLITNFTRVECIHVPDKQMTVSDRMDFVLEKLNERTRIDTV